MALMTKMHLCIEKQLSRCSQYTFLLCCLSRIFQICKSALHSALCSLCPTEGSILSLSSWM